MHEIRYSADFNKDYVKLRVRADRKDTESQYIIELISRATARLAENSEAGRKIPRRRFTLNAGGAFHGAIKFPN